MTLLLWLTSVSWQRVRRKAARRGSYEPLNLKYTSDGGRTWRPVTWATLIRAEEDLASYRYRWG